MSSNFINSLEKSELVSLRCFGLRLVYDLSWFVGSSSGVICSIYSVVVALLGHLL